MVQMRTSTSSSSRPALRRESFEALLRQLHPEPGEAAHRYRRTREKLVRLFAWRGCEAPEDLADETLDRVALQLGAGLEIKADDPYRYIAGVAHRVFLEIVRRNKRRDEKYREYGALSRQLEGSAAREDEENRWLECLNTCLEAMSSPRRELVLAYYEGEKTERIRRRKALAEKLQISTQHLRVRVYRIRHELEGCTRRCADPERLGSSTRSSE